MIPTKIAIAGAKSPEPRYARVLSAYSELSLIEVGMLDKNGTILATTDGTIVGMEATAPPSITYEVDDTLYELIFPLFTGWEILLSQYTSYTITVLFGKNLKGT